MSSAIESLLDATAALYKNTGKFAFHFARNKLRYDPVFLAVLKSGLIQSNMRVLDLGCGQGLLFALLRVAKSQYQSGLWPNNWPEPSSCLDLRGVELRDSEAAIARMALGSAAKIESLDLSVCDIPAADVVVLFDVLHYLDADAQVSLISRIARVMESGGLLLVRDADARAGFSFYLTCFAERGAAIGRGHWRQHFHFRSREQWNALLTQQGFHVEAMNMSDGTPFANLLWVARRV